MHKMFYQKVSVVHVHARGGSKKVKLKLNIFAFELLDLEKHLRNSGSSVHVCKFLVSFCRSYHGAAPVPYAHVYNTFLNLPHPYIKSTIVLLDKTKTVCLYVVNQSNNLSQYTFG